MGINFDLHHALISVTTMWAVLIAFYFFSPERPKIDNTARIWLTIVTVWVFIVAGVVENI